MLNTFPELLSFGLLGTALLRIAVGIIFAYFGWLKLTKDKENKVIFFEKIGFKPAIFWLWLVALIELVTGTMLVIGVLTQIAAMVASVIMFISIIIKIKRPVSLPNHITYYILFFIVFLSLIFTGAGLFAFDLPL